jgi:hypothetical protein
MQNTEAVQSWIPLPRVSSALEIWSFFLGFLGVRNLELGISLAFGLWNLEFWPTDSLRFGTWTLGFVWDLAFGISPP